MWPFRRGRVADTGPALTDDGTLPVLGASFDPARADSAVVAELEQAGVDVTRPLLVRHHLRLPRPAAVEDARRLLAPEGYALATEDAPDGAVLVRASRVEPLTGLSLARERTRMAGLAQRLGGSAAGWDACGPAPRIAARHAGRAGSTEDRADPRHR